MKQSPTRGTGHPAPVAWAVSPLDNDEDGRPRYPARRDTHGPDSSGPRRPRPIPEPTDSLSHRWTDQLRRSHGAPVQARSQAVTHRQNAVAGGTPMATIVIVHGAFGGGWEWREVAAILRARGHTVWTPSLT